MNPSDYIGVRLTKPQTRHYLLNCRFPLFVGGYGSGKTTTMITRAVSDLFDNPGVNIGMYEPTFDLLKLTLMPRLEELFKRMQIKYDINRADHIITVEGFGSLICRSLDNPNRLISYEVFRSHVDELDTLKQAKADDVWNRIIARQRQKSPLNPDAPNRCSVYTTPEGFRFTYNRWGKNPSESYKYVRAPTTSNPHLADDYIDSLYETYPEELVKAYIKGQWVNLKSGTCYYAFDRKIHCTTEIIRPSEPLHIGLDFNIYKMAASVNVERNGISYTVDEIYGLRDTPDIITEIKERYPGHHITVYPDASGKRGDTRSKKSDHKLLREAKFIVRSLKTNKPFSERALSVNKRFQNLQHFINIEKCPHLVEGLEQQVYDESGMPDKSQDLDHSPDSFGYYIIYRYPINRNSMYEKQTA